MNNKKQRFLAFFVGFLAILLFLEMGLRIVGYIYQKNRITSPRTLANSQKKNFVILCLGNSYTLGFGGPSGGSSYPSHLQRLFDEKNKKVTVINGGVGSQNTAELWDNLEDNINNTKPDLIVLQTGQPNWWNFYKYNNYLKRTSGIQTYFDKIYYSWQSFLYKSRVYKLLFLLKGNIDSKIRAKKLLLYKYKFEKDEEYWTLGELIEQENKDFFVDKQKVDKAIQVFKKGIEICPDFPKSYALLGCIYLHQKDYDAALDLFIKAVKVNPSFRNGDEENRGYRYIRHMTSLPLDGQEDRIRKKIDRFIEEFKKTDSKNFENLLFLSHDQINKWAESDIEEIIKIIQGKNIKIILQNYPVSAKFQAGEIDDILRDIAMRFNIPFVDNNKIFRQIMAIEGDKIDEKYFAPDQHCNSEGYKVIATSVYNKIISEKYLGT